MPHSNLRQSTTAKRTAAGRAVSAIILLLSVSTGFAAESTEKPGVLQIETLVADVLDRNRGIAALQSAVQAAEAGIVQAGALPDPTLTAAVAPQTIGGYDSPTGRGTNMRIELGQQLPWPGKLDLQEDTARYEALAAGEDVAALRLRLAALTRSTYAEWHYLHQALAINAESGDLLEQLRSVAETRYAAGLAQQQDVLQAEVELQHVRHRDIQLQRQRRAIQARLNSLLNQGPDTALPSPSGSLPAPNGLPSYAELQKRALSTHPELKRLEQQATASQRRVALAKKDFYPDFRVFTAYNGLWDADEKRWVVGAGINLPLNRRKRHAAVDQAEARGMQIEAELEDRRAQLLGALEQTRAAATEARHTIRLYENQLIPRSEENLSAARAAYSAGGGSFLNVITAEQLQLDARLGLERAQADYFSAVAELQRWTGPELSLNGSHLSTSEVQP